ncbi:MAG: ABC transporter permease [Candidatus Hermodarchaeota archaeon]
MTLNLNIKKNLDIEQIFEICKFELLLQKKRYIIITIISLTLYNLFAIFSLGAPNAIYFAVSSISQLGSFLMLICIFFVGGILADEFDKRTALTNFTKTERDNFFIGKTLAAFAVVLFWIGPAFIESILFSLILYGEVPYQIFIWFGYYCLVGGMYTCIYLLHSAIFRSGSQAMAMSFFTFIALIIAFGILGAFFGLWYLFPIYTEIAASAIFSGPFYDEDIMINVYFGVILSLAYMIPCLILAYLQFKRRDV